MLQKVDKDRLDKVLEVIESAKIKFPVATIAKELDRGKGEVSVYLRGKKPMSTNFYKTFIERFGIPKKEIVIPEADVGKELSRLIEISIKQQAAINVLMNAFGKVSAKVVEKEYEQLYDEYVKKQ